MKGIIFEIGLLAFFVSAVAFGSQGNSLFDTISRAFIVFICVELIATAALAIASSGANDTKAGEQQNHNEQNAAAASLTENKHQQLTVRTKA